MSRQRFSSEGVALDPVKISRFNKIKLPVGYFTLGVLVSELVRIIL